MNDKKSGQQVQRSPKKIHNPVIPASMTWKCVECMFILGYTDSSRTDLRIKFKDQYVTITKAESITCVCRRCAKFNKLTTLPE